MPKYASLTAEQERAWREYRRMRTLLDLAVQRDLRADSSLSDADYDVLTALAGVDGGRQRAGELAADLLWSTSRLAHQVGRMETRGLVRRTAVGEDARGAVIALTPAGRRTVRQAAPRHADSVRRHLFDRLSTNEIRTLARLAQRVAAELEG